MSYPDTYFHGKDGSLSVGATVVAIQNWKITDTAGGEDVTATTDGGYYVPQGGVHKATGSFQAKWLATTTPQSQGFAKGTKVANLVCYVNLANTIGWTFTLAYIVSLEPENSVNGVVTYTCNFESCGTYTSPT